MTCLLLRSATASWLVITCLRSSSRRAPFFTALRLGELFGQPRPPRQHTSGNSPRGIRRLRAAARVSDRPQFHPSSSCRHKQRYSNQSAPGFCLLLPLVESQSLEVGPRAELSGYVLATTPAGNFGCQRLQSQESV